MNLWNQWNVCSLCCLSISLPLHLPLSTKHTHKHNANTLDLTCLLYLAIRKEIRDIEEGRMDRLNNMLKVSSHWLSYITCVICCFWPFRLYSANTWSIVYEFWFFRTHPIHRVSFCKRTGTNHTHGKLLHSLRWVHLLKSVLQAFTKIMRITTNSTAK